jgi:hypothetical protein
VRRLVREVRFSPHQLGSFVKGALREWIFRSACLKEENFPTIQSEGAHWEQLWPPDSGQPASHAEAKLEVEAHPSSVLKQPLAGGFILEVANKNEILSDLDLMGINEYTLFGGLDGAFKHQKWKHLCPPEHNESTPKARAS